MMTKISEMNSSLIATQNRHFHSLPTKKSREIHDPVFLHKRYYIKTVSQGRHISLHTRCSCKRKLSCLFIASWAFLRQIFSSFFLARISSNFLSSSMLFFSKSCLRSLIAPKRAWYSCSCILACQGLNDKNSCMLICLSFCILQTQIIA